MEKERSDKLITEAAKTLFLYCRARTNSKEEAEDLSQDIILKLLRTKGTLRDDKAFYGFMWAVAGNVYKNWCKKRAKIIEGELDESISDNISDNGIPLAELLEKESDLRLLHRELGLLTEQYRKVVIMYYFNNLKVSDISKSLSITENMVKFLLFKSRKILKEGMNMEKTRGDLSFNPSNVGIMVIGEEARSLWDLFADNLIAQNILLACYNDRCTVEEISLQLGVAVPYLEKDLKKLCEKNLLIQKGGKYETAIVIFTKEFAEEAYAKTLSAQRETAEIIDRFLNERLNDVKAVGFHRGAEDDNLLKWQIASIIIGDAGRKYHNSVNSSIFPSKDTEKKSYVCGDEIYPSHPGRVIGTVFGSANGDLLNITDFSINNTGDFFYFDRYTNRVNIMLDIAKGKSDGFSESDIVEIAEFIKRGYVEKSGDKLSLRLSVFTKEQYEKIIALIDNITTDIANKICGIVNTITDILIQHTPVSMKKDAENIGWMKSVDCTTTPIKIMADNGILQRVGDNAHPTSFIVLC